MNATDQLGGLTSLASSSIGKGREGSSQNGITRWGVGVTLSSIIIWAHCISSHWVFYLHFQFFITIIKLILLFHTKFLLILLNSQSAFTKREARKELVWWGGLTIHSPIAQHHTVHTDKPLIYPHSLFLQT